MAITLPPPSSYREPIVLQRYPRDDLHWTRKSGKNYLVRMVDPHHPVRLPPALIDAVSDGRKASLGLTKRRESAQLVLSDERQNVCSRNASLSSNRSSGKENDVPEPLLIHHKKRKAVLKRNPNAQKSRSGSNPTGLRKPSRQVDTMSSARSISASATLSVDARGRDVSRSVTPDTARSLSSMSPDRRTFSTRPRSYVDLVNVPYPQNAPSPLRFDNDKLKGSIGRNAALQTRQKTLEMYRANVKKTLDAEVQYSFAILLIETAQELARDKDADKSMSPAELLLEARLILQRLADKGYPFAQYYLADGYASGFFNPKGRPDDDKAFNLFVSASKHGHAEAGYRAGLCYEFGWGSKKDPTKAIQFYRQSASKNHPGSMTRLSRACLSGDLGGGVQYKEGIKWLKRATEIADKQYNSAPYDLGCLHEQGYGDDIFKDEQYAAQLFTQAADLDHPDAAFKLGQAYEFGKLSCPEDPALSIHFYSIAANQDHAQAMFALCAWYMVGAGPVLQKDEAEAYEWAKKAAKLGLAKAQYAVAYFAEAGIGGRRDPLEANTWYVKAAEQGDEKAMKRIKAIRQASSGKPAMTRRMPDFDISPKIEIDDGSQKKWKIFKAV